MPDGLAEVADELYGLPLGEFVTERTNRTKAARADGDKALARAVAKLAKPSTSAWVVNMLVRAAPDEIEGVLDLGAALRQAQQDLDGAELRELTSQRQALVSAVLDEARTIAADLGHVVSEATATEVEQTVRAAMADEDATAALRSRQLTRPIAASGLGSLGIADVVAAPVDIGRAAARRAAKQPGNGSPGRKAPASRSSTAERAAAGDPGPADPDDEEPTPAPTGPTPDELAAAEERMEAARSVRAAADEAESTATDEVSTGENAVAELEAAIDELRATLRTRERELARAEQQLELARSRLDDAADASADARKEAAAAESALAALTS